MFHHVETQIQSQGIDYPYKICDIMEPIGIYYKAGHY